MTTAAHGALDPTLLFDLRHDPARQLTLGDIRAGRRRTCTRRTGR
ncbi:hypothetical protein [Nocardioides zeae]